MNRGRHVERWLVQMRLSTAMRRVALLFYNFKFYYIFFENLHIRKRREGVLVSRISSPSPRANHVAPPATKDENEYRGARSLIRVVLRKLR